MMSAGTSLTQVRHSDSRKRLSKQKGCVGWGERVRKGKEILLLHICLELCWHSVTVWKKIFMEIP